MKYVYKFMKFHEVTNEQVSTAKKRNEITSGHLSLNYTFGYFINAKMIKIHKIEYMALALWTNKL